MTVPKVKEIYPDDKVVIREVGLRDGLQLVKDCPSTEEKLNWLNIDYQAGIRHFEVGSYLPTDRFPQFADIDVLIDKVVSFGDAFSSVVVLNRRGALTALEGKADEITYVVSASEEHNLRNARRTREATLSEIRDVLELRKNADRKPIISVGIAMSFGCSISGNVPTEEVLWIVERCCEMGADVVNVADTVGYAGPRQVSKLVTEIGRVLGDAPIGVHLHDTRGMGVANAAAALDAGARCIDASLGGLGGCPFAPNATGNVVLEDIVFLCQTMGYATDIDISVLVQARDIIKREMPEEPLHGALAKAGLPLGFEERQRSG